MEKIKKCPMCGSIGQLEGRTKDSRTVLAMDAVLDFREHGDKDSLPRPILFRVTCTACPWVGSPAHDIEEAVYLWNTEWPREPEVET